MTRTKQTARHASVRGAVAANVPRCFTLAWAPAGVRFSIRFRRSTRALIEIHKWQRLTDLIYPELPFLVMVREVVNECIAFPRFALDALYVLRCECEAYLVGLFEDTNLLAIRPERQTINKKDLLLARGTRDESDYILWSPTSSSQ